MASRMLPAPIIVSWSRLGRRHHALRPVHRIAPWSGFHCRIGEADAAGTSFAHVIAEAVVTMWKLPGR